jgi:hypothetical protein
MKKSNKKQAIRKPTSKDFKGSKGLVSPEKYTFGIKANRKLGYKGIILQDKTQLILNKDGLNIMLPREKFVKIFNKQIKDKKRTHIGITFNYQELNALLVGFEELLKK